MNIFVREFGKTSKNEEIFVYTLKNDYMEVEILNYGGIIKKILVPDKKGNLENIVLSFDTLKEYEDDMEYVGATVGRVAGRIKKGELFIKDKKFLLEINDKNNCLHGGIDSLNKKKWIVTYEIREKELELKLDYTSPHLENKFPGEVKFTIKYILKENELFIDYSGIPDRETYINLTNHSYFNLSGNMKRDISKQKLTLNSKEYLEIDKEFLPKKKSSVIKTDFDLRNGRVLNKIFSSKEEQVLTAGKGIDHAFILSKEKKIDGILFDEISGRYLEFVTDQPTMVIYTGNYLKKTHTGICFEAQNYPDINNISPENMQIYTKNKIYIQKTKFIFHC